MISSIGILSFGDAFAEHVVYKTRDEMEKIDVKLIFVTSFDECSKNNWEAIEGYSIMTGYYLWKYNIVANKSIDCINKDRVSFAVDNSLSSNDLTIIFPDILNSLDWLIAKSKLGHYTWNGNDRTIVTHALTLNADSASSVWTLSHELSHFALEWYDYPRSVFGDGVHKAQADYDECFAYDSTGAMCRNLWELLESAVTGDVGKTMGVKYRVMEPLRSERNHVSSYGNPIAQPTPTYNNDLITLLSAEYTINGIKNSRNQAFEGDTFCLNYQLQNLLCLY